MNPSILAPDDFRVGLYVTIVKGEIKQSPGYFECEDHSYQGEVLLILAIDLPFIVVRFPQRPEFPPGTFDIRQGWQFKKLSDEFVAAVLQEKP